MRWLTLDFLEVEGMLVYIMRYAGYILRFNGNTDPAQANSEL
jgi:hypothetical protein